MRSRWALVWISIKCKLPVCTFFALLQRNKVEPEGGGKERPEAFFPQCPQFHASQLKLVGFSFYKPPLFSEGFFLCYQLVLLGLQTLCGQDG